ncbi:MAG: DUF5658 family protein [Dehalococcoidales bacterium]|jgi:hypothetical protein
MVTGWWESSATFKKSTGLKISFIALSVFDLVLTVLAMYLGFWEVNPFIRLLINIPVLFVLIKFVIPVLIAWLMPGKLLLPSIILLAIVFLWNVKELLVFVL